MATVGTESRYKLLVEKIFFDKYSASATEIEWAREELVSAAAALKIKLPQNLGDVVYSIRYRTPMPAKILAKQPKGMEWIIEGRGKSRYAFKLVRVNRIKPNTNLLEIKVPDATPELIATYSLSDEQALLAKVRYNRLVDIFLGLAAYSLQNHLRTSVQGIGQIEIDEIYVGVDKKGAQYVLPIQAKSGTDQLSVVQTKQDLACCAEKFPALICRAISAQFMDDNLIALFELTEQDGNVKVVDERHYRLVHSSEITAEDLRRYAN